MSCGMSFRITLLEAKCKMIKADRSIGFNSRTCELKISTRLYNFDRKAAETDETKAGFNSMLFNVIAPY